MIIFAAVEVGERIQNAIIKHKMQKDRTLKYFELIEMEIMNN